MAKFTLSLGPGRLREADESVLLRDYQQRPFELKISLNSPIDRDIYEHKTIMLAPAEGIHSASLHKTFIGYFEEANIFNEDLPSPNTFIYRLDTLPLIQKIVLRMEETTLNAGFLTILGIHAFLIYSTMH